MYDFGPEYMAERNRQKDKIRTKGLTRWMYNKNIIIYKE